MTKFILDRNSSLSNEQYIARVKFRGRKEINHLFHHFCDHVLKFRDLKHTNHLFSFILLTSA